MNIQLIYTFLLLPLFFGMACQQKIRPKRDRYYPSPKDYVNINPYKSPQERSQQHPELAVGVALSGGGSRAYGFAAGVLLGLEEIDNQMRSNYLHELDYISAVSGGGFTAACLIASRHAHKMKFPQKPYLFSDYYEGFVKEALLKNYALPIGFARLDPRTLFHGLDSGDALEKQIDNYVCGRKLRKSMGLPLESITLGDIFVPSDDSLRKVEFPHFVSNASLTSNIRLFTFAPQTLEYYKVSGYVHRFKNYQFDRPIDPYSLPLSVGVKASGTFPAAVMNTTLSSTHKGGKYLHLFDGGMADNVGWRAAIDMLKEDTIARKKILLVVDVDMNAYPNTFSNKRNGGFFLSTLFKIPFSGLDSRRMMRNKEIEEKCAVFGIQPIYLDFTALIKDNLALPPERIWVKEERQRLIEMISREEKLSDKDLQILYELAVGIPTKYTLNSRELEFLVTIGKEVTRQQASLLKSFLEPFKAK